MEPKTRDRLAAFTQRLQGQLGAIPLDRAIRADLDLFKMLRDSGATWVQIANALTSAGARCPSGELISADRIRSAVSRQLKRSAATEDLPTSSVVPIENTLKKPPKRTLPKPCPQHVSDASAPTQVTVGRIGPTSLDDERNSSILGKLSRTRRLRET